MHGPSFSCNGPIARTIDDVTLLFNALSGRDPHRPAGRRSHSAQPREIKRLARVFRDDDLTP